MSRAKALLGALMVVTAGAGAVGTTASSASIAETTAAPLRVKIAPFAGTKVMVAKKLKVIVSCSRDCTAKARIKLITPAGSTSVKGGRILTSDQGWITGMVLTGYGISVLKNHFRRSRLKVAVTARDTETGRVVHKTRFFRFRR